MAQALSLKELTQGLYQGHISNHYLVPLNLRKTDDLPELGPPKTSLRRNIPPASPKTNSDSSAPSTQTTTRKSGFETFFIQN